MQWKLEDTNNVLQKQMLRLNMLPCLETLVSCLFSPMQPFVKMCSDSSRLFWLISRVLFSTFLARGKKMFHKHAVGHVWVIGYYPTQWLDVISGAQRPWGGMLMENKRSIQFGLSQCLSSVFLSVESPLPVTTLTCLNGLICACTLGHLDIGSHTST